MKPKEAIMEMHKAAAEHAVEMAEGHRNAEKCFAGMGKGFEKAAEAHGMMGASCEKAAANHLANAKAIKSSIDEDLARIVPDGVSSIAKTDAPETAFGIRAVPRHGQPLDREDVTKNVPPVFRHLVSGGDEN